MSEETVDGLRARIELLEKTIASQGDYEDHLSTELSTIDRLLVEAGIVADDETEEKILKTIPRVKLALERLREKEQQTESSRDEEESVAHQRCLTCGVVFKPIDGSILCTTCADGVVCKQCDTFRSASKRIQEELQELHEAQRDQKELKEIDSLLEDAGVVSSAEKPDFKMSPVMRARLAVKKLKANTNDTAADPGECPKCHESTDWDYQCPACGFTEVIVEDLSMALVSFFYELARDHVVIGELNSVLSTSVGNGTVICCDKGLEAWAKNFVHYFMTNTPPEWVEKLVPKFFDKKGAATEKKMGGQ